MPLENGVYISKVPPKRDSFSLAEIDELVPGTIKRVQKLLDAQTSNYFKGVERSLKEDLKNIEISPIDIGLDGGKITSNRLQIREDLTLNDLLITLGMYLIANQNNKPSGPIGKFDRWGNRYTGKRRNKIRA